MAAQVFSSIISPKNILSLVELEISIIERYHTVDKGADSISLIYFRLPSEFGYDKIFEEILRQTDVVIKEREHCIAILYATDKLGASLLLGGIQEFLNEKPIDLVLSYPNDASNAWTLLTKFQDEIKDNYGVLLDVLSIDNEYEIFENIL
ncbi:pyridoxal-5'-phosphate-dependent protein [Campylobacter sp. faydin G-24]|uniref:Pyridoxal-5'-phosphate-dependent protein n=1 Tax=Campylobacter anatolicus TaxID=2829105 RepID=A0ABS5HIZ6_9BACT|nr:pyridoxal-5'-phosphate-dependent protein [Campylobacter anatolicus]MBR8462719.1 pyridoxal-5'-phosphate-dependent protein [Campylobacter anatolicus]MBR8464113.1 pyridoxal-5'-phosphate-dependent protein [Campylobacter anatolicus]MBR8466018.1 pyridoxal-5'-phosphate-dependent protein [Campylobacter anatolicus]